MSSKAIAQKLVDQQIQESQVSKEMIQSLSAKMYQLQSWIQLKKEKVIIILEGASSPTKDQFIDQLRKSYPPTFVKYYNSDKIIDEKVKWHFQPLIANLPETGQITIFDSCWHGNKKHNKLSNGQLSDSQSISQLEQSLQSAGYQVVKYWFQENTENFQELIQTFVSNSIHQNKSALLDQLHIQSSHSSILSISYKDEVAWHLAGGQNAVLVLHHFVNQMNIQDLSFNNAAIEMPLLNNSTDLIWAKAKENVIALNTFHPNFPIAKEIQQAMEVYTKNGIVLDKPIEGLQSFREIAAKVMTEKKGLNCRAECILPIDGTIAGIFTIAQFVLRPGDEAIVFDPTESCFTKAIEARGSKVIHAPCHSQSGKFEIESLEALVTPNTKMICLSNPQSLAGRVMRWDELFEIGKFAIKHQLWILNDESWSDIIYSPNHHFHIGSLNEKIAARTFSVYGFSKTFGLADLPVGFIVAPNEIILKKLMQVSNVHNRGTGVSTLSQVAATAAFRDAWYWKEAFVDHLQSMRDYMVERFNKMHGVQCNTPEGTYVLMVDITAFGMNSEQMCDYLLQNAKVAVMPSTTNWSGPTSTKQIGISFSSSKAIIKEALDRIEQALNALPRYQKLSKN